MAALTPSSVALACGILMERHHMGAAEAAQLLEDVAGALRLEPVTLADGFLALLSPEHVASPADGWAHREGSLGLREVGSTAEAWRVLEELPQLRASAVDSMVRAVALANEDGDAAAQLVADLTGASPDRAVIYAVGEDNALMLVGNVGTPADVLGAWRQVPLVLDIPLSAAVNQNRSIFIESGDEMEATFPATRGSREGSEAWVSVPIREGRLVIGVLGLSWTAPRSFDETSRARITRAVERAGPIMVRSLRGADPEPGLLADLMHLVPDPWLVVTPVGPAEEESFVIEGASPTLPGGDLLVGQALDDAFPNLLPEGETLGDIRQVLRTGALLVRSIQRTRPDGSP
ncbi:MAG TPA: ANTAR domain-containing protein, partial [Candidatus Nanopelagicales bacterium]